MRIFTSLIISLSCASLPIMALADISTGAYSGKFGEAKATIFIDSINNGTIKGRSLYLQNYRTLTGTVKAEGSYWRVLLNEPADRTGDGQFSLLVAKSTPTVLTGSWKVFAKNDTKKGIAPKNFSLSKSSCGFKKGKGYNPEASERLLEDDDLFMSAEELDGMRNEIFARHGYSFKDVGIASEYATEDWYVPCYTNVDQALSPVEKENIKRIIAMTAYAKKNPSKFGR
ncbi:MULTISPECIES: YARHG domain-containing protein [unclassified Moraxella]|uniref:YARHG domain-containing protein n=1 Tax=unclassified Moraxella TaxID=2685852 RepID=UPI003AF93FC7